jgi:ribosomal protein S18 acetylase RimI-like enzyme
MIEVEKACLADSRGIADIQVEGWKVGYRGILPDDYLDRLSTEARVPMWERFIRDGKGTLFVARSGAELSGFCHLIPSRDEDGEGIAEIAAIYVDPGQWRKGSGRRLVEAAFASAIEQGFSGVTLWVLTENSRGRGFYEAMGMRPDGATKSEGRSECLLHEIRYRVDLSACGSS